MTEIVSTIPFIDLAAQQRRIKPALDEAIARVLAHGKYILGPEVAELEKRLAAYCGAKHVVGCANGTDALLLALMRYDVGPGEAVFVPSFTFVAAAEVIALLGAAPVFVDVDPETYLINTKSLEAAIPTAKGAGLRPSAVIPVDLFGQPADYAAIEAIAAADGLNVIADAAQSYGASRDGKRVGTLAPLTTTSFFPAKPLGCYGDGGALLTDDDETAEVLRSLLMHGRGENKYDHPRVGINGRLDSLQAAILIAKLDIFDDEIASRNRIAARYDEALSGIVATPIVADGATSVWAQYTIRVPNRDQFVARLTEQGIPTAIHYPKPLHRQAAYSGYPVVAGGVEVSETLAEEVVSLPFHPYLDESVQDRVANAVRLALSP